MFEMVEPAEPELPAGPSPADPLRALDEAHAEAGRAFLRMLELLRELERTGRWGTEGARDTAHLIQMRYGLSGWKARRMVEAARALPRLPALAEALELGVLGPDKAMELARFATPATERDLVSWARRVSYGAVRRRGELAERALREQAEQLERERRCAWYYFDAGRRFRLEAELPAADGARLAAAIQEVAARVPVMPGEEDASYAPARRADALLALCTRGADGEGPARGTPPSVRATVVIHSTVGAITGGTSGGELEGGGVAHPATLERLACTGLVEHVHEGRFGELLHRISERRTPPAWMARQVRYRDRGCTFPGCGARAHTEAHHITFHRFGGKTTLENLALVCSFHHRLVHEHGWAMRRTRQGGIIWRRPDGRVHAPGPVLRGADVDPVPEPVVYGPFERGGEQARDGPHP